MQVRIPEIQMLLTLTPALFYAPWGLQIIFFLYYFIVGFPEGGTSACQGDSGGPMVTKATGVDDAE